MKGKQVRGRITEVEVNLGRNVRGKCINVLCPQGDWLFTDTVSAGVPAFIPQHEVQS